MLDVKKELNGDTLTVTLTGRLDTVTAPQLEEELKDSISGVKSLIFDIKALEYVSSAGLRVFLSNQKLMNKQGHMKLVGPTEDVKEIFNVTGFMDILTIED
ncbi:MAG: STAS domain-containing protein [Lachnospiraceae bacterium]|nr:STAS domain-containing protein [Lachnospiraceae bacterium]